MTPPPTASDEAPARVVANGERNSYARPWKVPSRSTLHDEIVTMRQVLKEARREAARTALNNYRGTVFPTYQVSINEYLRKFNAGFRLDQITPQNTRAGSACTYNVLINNQPIVVGASTTPGQPSFRNSLSAGDRNTLALAFFFASLDQDPALADKVVVIDDPVSSLDEHRSLTTVQEIRRMMQRSAQVIVLSHNKPFLCNIWEGTDDTLRAALDCHFFSFSAARRTLASLTLPVTSRICLSVASERNWGIGCDRFLFSVSLRFCWISPSLSR